MGWLQDLLFGKKQMPEYGGGQQLLDLYNNVNGMQLPTSGGLQTDIRNLTGQIGNDSLSSAAREYMMGTLSGNGTNPYESQAFQNLRTSTLGQLNKDLGGLSSTLAAKGLTRGSGAERTSGQVISNAENQLAQQGFQAEQAGLARQAQIGLAAPQIALKQQGLGLQGLGMIGNLGQQDITNQLNLAGLQGNLASAINQSYVMPQRGGGLANVLGSVAGGITGALTGNPAGALSGILSGSGNSGGQQNYQGYSPSPYGGLNGVFGGFNFPQQPSQDYLSFNPFVQDYNNYTVY